MAILKLKKNGAPAVSAQPSAADLDAVAKEAQIKEATAGPEASPLSTPPAHPEVPEQPSAPAFAPESVPTAPSFLTPNEDQKWSDGVDTSKVDSLGNKKTDKGAFGPKGENPPADVQTDEQRQKAVDVKEARMREHMPNTAGVDSVGKPKGYFQVTPQGFDKHGARIPDKVDTSVVVEEHAAHVGPRGVGAPKDTFHGSRPLKK